jgi:ATP/maltotriose-dependent transcriptional regulator MalT
MAASGDHDAALSLLTATATRCHWGNVTGEAVDELLALAEGGSLVTGTARRLFVEALAAPAERGAGVLGRLASMDPPAEPYTALFLVAAANSVGAFGKALSFCGTAEARLREQGRLGILARFLTARSWAAIWAADLPAALTSADEAVRLAAETAQPHWETEAMAHRAIIAALRGERGAAESLAARAEAAALAVGTVSHLALAVYARGLAALSDGRHARAYELLRRVREPADPAFHDAFATFDIADLAEAAAYSGHRDAARQDLLRAESLAEKLPSPWLRAALRHARALLADDQDAENLFKDADSHEGMAQWPLLHARVRLAYGEWLRRQRRSADARTALRAARDSFDVLGAAPWGERARRELLAAGEHSRAPVATPLDMLTPQELQIVQLAAQGLSNGEIAERLYLSRRTIESHLYRAFPKLGIASRVQLPEVFDRERAAPRGGPVSLP